MAAQLQALPMATLGGKAIFAFLRWLRTHRGAIAMAGLLAFAAPATYFASTYLVSLRDPTGWVVLTGALWLLAYAIELWCLLLVFGYVSLRTGPAGRLGRFTWHLLCACAAVACVELLTRGRVRFFVEMGTNPSELILHLYTFSYSFVVALLYFSHLRSGQAHEAAAARLAAAQAAQRDARRRLVGSRLQALQARIDPRMLFDLLDKLRRGYETDPASAESLLDELVAFLRAALPRLRSASSSLAREAQLAQAYARLRALAGESEVTLALAISADALHARFPPGVLLPLLDNALRSRAGPCRIGVTCQARQCRLVLELPAMPSPDTLERVRTLLSDLYADAAELAAGAASGGSGAVEIVVILPYELA